MGEIYLGNNLISKTITKVSELKNDVPYAVEDVPSNGVYAVTAEGELINYNNADSSCIGVALVAGEHTFMIAKSDATDGTYTTLCWDENYVNLSLTNYSNADGTNPNGYFDTSSTRQLNKDFTTWTAGALSDFNGKANTVVIAAASSYARDMCTVLNTFNASDSYKDWYIPSCGQLALINLNKTEINAALTKIGGTALSEYYYWSSSEYDSSIAWYVSLSHNYVGNNRKNNGYCVRFIRDISIPSLKERVSKLESEMASKADVEIKISNGVYAVLPNGQLVSYYEADESCIGVVAVEDDFKIMVYKYEVGQSFQWGAVEDYTLDNYDTLFEDKYFTKFGDGEVSQDYKQWTSGALSDFKGKENTKMLNIPSITPLHMINLANRANLPDEPGFNNLGYQDWYIPSMGQLAYLYKNVEVANMLRKIGGDEFSELWGYWSSTERSADTAWYVEFQMGYVRADYRSKDSSCYVRLIRDYNPPTVIETLENKIYSNVYSKEEIDGMLAISKQEFVDLGLPSGLKWATCNVGAENPEEAGLYFAWGETKGYSGITGDKIFNFSDYKLCNGTIEPLILTKYNTNSQFGTVDNLTTLELVDDAAHQNDKTCRMPTVEDFNELMANTTSVVEALNGVNGRRFTSKINGNSVFIPSAGNCYNGSVNLVGDVGFYWSNSCYEMDPINIETFCFSGQGDSLMDICFRWQGNSVRAVQEPNSPSEIVSKVSNKADKIFVIDHGTEDTTFTLTPNTYHKWGTVTSLTLTLGTLSDTSVYKEYMFEFISGTTATTLSLPSTISWASEPNIEAGKTYQVSILNNCGIIGGF